MLLTDHNDLLDAAEQELIVLEHAQWQAYQTALRAKTAYKEHESRVKALRAIAKEMEAHREQR